MLNLLPPETTTISTTAAPTHADHGAVSPRSELAQTGVSPSSPPWDQPAEYFDQPTSPKRPNSEPHSRNPSFSRRSHGLPIPPRPGLLDQHLQHRLAQEGGSHGASTDLPSPLESPRSPPYRAAACYSGSLGSNEVASRYGTVNSSSNAPPSTDTCPNCSLSIPKSVSEKLPEGAPGSPTTDGRGKNGSPVLRTREAFLTRGGSGGAAPTAAELAALEEKQVASLSSSKRRGSPRKQKKYPSKGDIASPPTPATSVRDHDLFPSSSSDDDPHSCSSSAGSPGLSRTSTFGTSFPSTPPSTPPAHAHTLTYLTTRQPSSLDAHSLLRRSCIRTLSCEQLPRTHSGPLFFGDDRSGYTISFVFRLPDPCARGRVRRYAFIAWAGRDERRAARAYKDVLHVFAAMAGRIVDMVEKRETGACTGGGVGSIGRRGSSGVGGVDGRESVPVSSFLSGRSIDPDGYPRRPDVRAKGLAELVGKEDVFVDMHAAFVHLLAQLGRNLGGWPMGMIVDGGIRGDVGETSTNPTTTNTKSVAPPAVTASTAVALKQAEDSTMIDAIPDDIKESKGKEDGITKESRQMILPLRTASSVKSSPAISSSSTHALTNSTSTATTTATVAGHPIANRSMTKSPISSTPTVPAATSTTMTTTTPSSSSSSPSPAAATTPSATASPAAAAKGYGLDVRAPSPLETVSRRQIAV